MDIGHTVPYISFRQMEALNKREFSWITMSIDVPFDINLSLKINKRKAQENIFQATAPTVPVFSRVGNRVAPSEESVAYYEV